MVSRLPGLLMSKPSVCCCKLPIVEPAATKRPFGMGDCHVMFASVALVEL